MESKKIGKGILATLGVIILGAIGSGAWQYIGDPLLTFIVSLSIDFMNSIFGSYLDDIYIKASKGFHEDSSTSLYIFLTGGVPLFILGVVTGYEANFKGVTGKKHQQDKDAEIAELKRNRTKVKLMFYFTLALFVVISLVSAAQQFYVNNVVTYVETTLDRLAPYEEQKDILLLRAQFREVRSTEDYHQFYEKLEESLDKHGLQSYSIYPL